MNVTICKKIEPMTESLKKEFEELSSDQEDWRAPIKAKLMSLVVAADLREIKQRYRANAKPANSITAMKRYVQLLSLLIGAHHFWNTCLKEFCHQTPRMFIALKG